MKLIYNLAKQKNDKRMKKTIKRIKRLFSSNKKTEPSPEVLIKVSRQECFCESACNEYCYTKK